MPKEILTAYANFQENLKVYSSFALGLGAPHQRVCGIPQGCPLSMMFTALLLRPWMVMVKDMGACPRTLADNLLATTSGKEHLDKLIAVTEATQQFLQDFGGEGCDG